MVWGLHNMRNCTKGSQGQEGWEPLLGRKTFTTVLLWPAACLDTADATTKKKLEQKQRNVCAGVGDDRIRKNSKLLHTHNSQHRNRNHMGEKERKLLHKQLILAHSENELEELTDKKKWNNDYKYVQSMQRRCEHTPKK